MFRDTIIYKVTQVGDSTTLSQILSLIEETKKFKGNTQNIGSTFKKIVTILTLIIAFGTGIAWAVTGGGIFVSVLTTVSILLIANPEGFAFGALAPYSYGIEKAASRGMLFRGGKIIDKASRIKRIIFDKTGTITYGIPEITNIIPKEGFNDKRFLILLGSLENSSAHPFAATIVEYCKTKRITLKKAYDFKSIEGLGIKGIVDGQEIIAGNMKLMDKSNVQMNKELLHKAEILSKNVRTPVYVARNRELIGVVGIADSIKEDAKEAINDLNKKRYLLTLITGDNEKIAEHIANELRIKDSLADMLQKEKIEAIQNFQDKKEVVAFVGDGINDATALAQADVGISTGTGTDCALEVSDITFISDDLRLIESALKSSQIIKQIARQNIISTFIYHLVAIPAAAGVSYLVTGFILHPAIAPLIMGLSFFALTKSSLRLKKLI
ncbi:heavy metal translocating P-type ATPase [Patescibacteria group bacterium]